MDFAQKLTSEEEKFYIEKLKSGDKEARNKLIEHNLRLVAHIVKKFSEIGIEREDLISIGSIGLIKGIDTYKTDKNIRLNTYVSRCIENEILMAVRKKRNENKRRIFINVYSESDSLESYLDRLSINLVGLEEQYIEKNYREDIKDILKKLPERERKILISRFYHNKTQSEIGIEHNIKQETVSKLLKKTFTKIRPYFESEPLTKQDINNIINVNVK